MAITKMMHMKASGKARIDIHLEHSINYILQPKKAWGSKSGRRYQLPAGDGLPTDEGDKADVWQNRRKAGISFCHIIKTWGGYTGDYV